MKQTKPKALGVALSPALAAEVHALLRQDFDYQLLADVSEAQTLLEGDGGYAFTDAHLRRGCRGRGISHAFDCARCQGLRPDPRFW